MVDQRSDGSAAMKVAVITGRSHGIGAGLVTAYRREGWAVVANSRTIEPSDDADILTIDGDVSDSGTTDRIATGALDRFGRIDTLVNNAGVFISKPFTDYTWDDYAHVVSVNLTGFFILTQRAIGEMVGHGGGHIVNITTPLVDYADSKVPSALTSLTKGGLAAVTRSLAIEYASRGIRVNAVSFMGASGVRVLVGAHRLATMSSVPLTLRRPSRTVVRVLAIAGVLDLIVAD